MSKYRVIIRRLLWTVALITVYALGQQLPLPLIDQAHAADVLRQGAWWQIVGSLTGGSLDAATLFSLGLAPYMTAMICWQVLAALDLPSINRLSRRQNGYFQNGIALILAVGQAITFAKPLAPALVSYEIGRQDWAFAATVVMLVAGAMLTIFLGNLNMMHGFGGTLALIMPGMLVRLPQLLANGWGQTQYPLTPGHVVAALLIVAVFLPLAIRFYQAEVRLPIIRPLAPSPLVQGYVPLRLLGAGAMPFMFSTLLFTLPRWVVTKLGAADLAWGRLVLSWTAYTHWQGVLAYALVVWLLGWGFAVINVQPWRQARQMKEAGDYFPSVRPGEATEHFLLKHVIALNLVANTVITIIAGLPLVIGLAIPGIANFSPMIGNLFILVTVGDNVSQQFLAVWNKDRYQLFDD